MSIPILELAAQVQDLFDQLDLVGRHVDGAERIINARAPKMGILVYYDGEPLQDRRFDDGIVTLFLDEDDHVLRVVHG